MTIVVWQGNALWGHPGPGQSEITPLCIAMLQFAVLFPQTKSQCCCQRVASVSVRGGEAARDPGHCGDILVLVGDQAQGRPPSPPRCVIELETYLREVESFTITEKTHTRTFSWLKAK